MGTENETIETDSESEDEGDGSMKTIRKVTSWMIWRSQPRDPECARVRAALEQGRRGNPEEAHLFVCSECRDEARLSAAWKAFASAAEVESADLSPVDERFVRGVLARVRADRGLRDRVRVRLLAAAALLFFFLAGASQKIASASSAGVEDTYAQMVTPDLDSELPD